MRRSRGRTHSGSGSIFTASFDSGKDLADGGSLALMRTHTDPTNFPLRPDNEGGSTRKIDRVDAEGLVDAISTRYFPAFIEKDWKWVGVFLHVFLTLKEPIDFLRGDEDDSCVVVRKFVVGRLKLSQLALTVWSPCSADKYEGDWFAAVLGKSHDFPIVPGKREIRCRIAEF